MPKNTANYAQRLDDLVSELGPSWTVTCTNSDGEKTTVSTEEKEDSDDHGLDPVKDSEEIRDLFFDSLVGTCKKGFDKRYKKSEKKFGKIEERVYTLEKSESSRAGFIFLLVVGIIVSILTFVALRDASKRLIALEDRNKIQNSQIDGLIYVVHRLRNGKDDSEIDN